MGVPGNADLLLLRTAAGAAATAGRSVRFNSADSAFLSRTPASAGNRKTWTWSGWAKRSKLGAISYTLFGVGSGPFLVRFTDDDGGDGLRIYNNSPACSVITSSKFRDPSAWYHVVIACDTTQATASNRLKIYVNNIQQTTFSQANYPAQNDDLLWNSTNAHSIGAQSSTGSLGFDGYLALVHSIDGQALTPSSFGETSATTGQWIAKDYSGSYGTNGFFLDFSNNSAATATTLGKDNSGVNSNNWTPNNLSVTAGSGNDSLRDHPTSAGTSTGAGGEVSGNYCTWNPLTGAITLTNGNLDGNSTGGAWKGATGIAGVSSGKWYWESTIQNTDSGNYYGEFGFIKTTDITGAIASPSSLNGIVYYARNGRKISGGTSVVTSSSGATTNDVVQVAVDLDAGKIWFGVNNTWIDSGNPASGTNAAYTGLSGTYLPVIGVLDGGKCNTNFGARAFAYSAPSGFSPLVDTLLPTPTIAKPNTVMDALLWTGNGSARSITGLGFNPDLVWIKGRSGGTDHALYDVVRGAAKRLESNNADAEVTSDGGVTAFNSDGFSLGTLAQVNTNSATYVGWTWDAGSSNATNTSGTITSTVRANISAGFSVVTYTGNGSNATVGHGLGVAPQWITVKRRDTTGDWATWHTSIANTNYLLLNSTAAFASGATYWNSTSPTSSLFSVGTATNTNANTGTYVAYCWTPVAGYSAFGSYTGNGSSDGPFVYTGFRPAVVIVKRSNGAADWVIQDNKRPGYNTNTLYLRPNSHSEETDSTGETNKNYIDFLSNGFKLRGTDLNTNAAQTYIYCAWAEAPFPYARAR